MKFLASIKKPVIYLFFGFAAIFGFISFILCVIHAGEFEELNDYLNMIQDNSIEVKMLYLMSYEYTIQLVFSIIGFIVPIIGLLVAIFVKSRFLINLFINLFVGCFALFFVSSISLSIDFTSQLAQYMESPVEYPAETIIKLSLSVITLIAILLGLLVHKYANENVVKAIFTFGSIFMIICFILDLVDVGRMKSILGISMSEAFAIDSLLLIAIIFSIPAFIVNSDMEVATQPQLATATPKPVSQQVVIDERLIKKAKAHVQEMRQQEEKNHSSLNEGAVSALRELKSLKDEGILSEEEYEIKRKKYLNQL